MADRSAQLAQCCRMSCQLAILHGTRIGETHPISEPMIAETIRTAIREVLGYVQNARRKLEGRDGFSMARQEDLELLLAKIAKKYGIQPQAEVQRG